jgi:hypothetical protein
MKKMIKNSCDYYFSKMERLTEQVFQEYRRTVRIG